MLYFGFAIADGMFPQVCRAERRPLNVEGVRLALSRPYTSCLNPSHAATITAAKERFGLSPTIPEKPPQVSLRSGDSVIVMSVRGLPRLEGARHEYTAGEIQKATFAFGLWTVE